MIEREPQGETNRRRTKAAALAISEMIGDLESLGLSGDNSVVSVNVTVGKFKWLEVPMKFHNFAYGKRFVELSINRVNFALDFYISAILTNWGFRSSCDTKSINLGFLTIWWWK